MSGNNTPMTIDELRCDSDDECVNEHVFPVYLCTRDSAITRDNDGNPIPYKNATNDDLPDINVFIKTLLFK